ncbi:zinc dependent phospholipase C family protein [Bacillus sp. FJAT-25509]|uniref:zinc dependent phospholipase C family protein n=1 Tax=Bacillus sp. FJAT-25509 TaxID=1712029 RepID=UPI0006F7E69D|nr:zinc dependent phospholipase C family protein [Bacillus sp. FJAT-25509]
MKKRIQSKKLLSLVAGSAIAITSLLSIDQKAFAWSDEDVHNQDHSTHHFIVNGSVKLIADNTNPAINKPTILLNQFRDRWEQGLYDADHINPFYDTGTFLSHFYDPDTQTNYTGASYPTARQSGAKYFNLASDYYKKGDFNNAFYYLGVSLHYFTDVTQPLHASNISNLDHNAPGYHSKFENYAESIQSQMTVPNSGLYNWISSTDPEAWIHQAAVQANSVLPQVWNDTIINYFWQAAYSNYYSAMWKNEVKNPTLVQLNQAERETAGFIDLFFRVNGVDMPVTVYKENAFGGASEILGSGNYDYDQLVKGIGNDTISSIHIAPGYQVTLYSDSNYKGASIVLTEDVNDLGNFNHQISSLKIVKISAISK